jgi:hypothetical protein
MTIMMPSTSAMLTRALFGPKRLEPKPTDVVVAVPGKSRLAHQLAAAGHRAISGPRCSLPVRCPAEGGGGGAGKSGTTWLMHMAHQLRMQGMAPDFGDQVGAGGEAHDVAMGRRG